MTVNELIKKLQELRADGKGDYDVLVRALSSRWTYHVEIEVDETDKEIKIY